jgi:hypothetical protein
MRRLPYWLIVGGIAIGVLLSLVLQHEIFGLKTHGIGGFALSTAIGVASIAAVWAGMLGISRLALRRG